MFSLHKTIELFEFLSKNSGLFDMYKIVTGRLYFKIKVLINIFVKEQFDNLVNNKKTIKFFVLTVTFIPIV